MKKKGIVAFLIVFVAMLTFGLTACSGETNNVAVMDLDVEESIELNVGGTKTLSPIVIPYNASDKTLKYTSSNESVATVNQNGKVVAVGAGNCEIIIKAVNDLEKRVSVSVYERVNDVSIVNVVESSVVIKKPDAENSYVVFTKKSDTYHDPVTAKINAKVSPDSAKQYLEYESNSTFASVDENGLVTFANIPTATVGAKNVEITVRSKDNKEKFQVVYFELQFYENFRFDLESPKGETKYKLENNVLTVRENNNIILRTAGSVVLSSSDGKVVFEPEFTMYYEVNGSRDSIPVSYSGYKLELKLPSLPPSGFNGQATITIKEAKTKLEIKHTITIKYLVQTTAVASCDGFLFGNLILDTKIAYFMI